MFLTISILFYNNIQNSSQLKKIYLTIIFIPLLLLSALRAPTVGTDTQNYLNGFNAIKNTDFANIFNVVRYERGYVLLNWISKNISDYEQIILIVTSSIVLFGVFYFIYRHSTNVILSVYLYLTLYLYFFSFNGIRQAIAMSIIVWGFHFIVQRKFISYLIIIILATLFHETSLLLITLYFIYDLKLDFKNIMTILGSFLFIFISVEYLIDYILGFSRSLSYIETPELTMERGGLLFPLINISILLFVIYIKNISNINDKQLSFYIYIILLGVLSSILSMKVYKLLRLNYYFLIFYIVAIPYAITFIDNKKRKLVISYITILVSGVYCWVRLSNGWQRVTPYEFSDFVQIIVGGWDKIIEPLVSIIVPVYNTGSYLRQCLESILNQSYNNIELIVINDGSTDNSLDIIQEYRQYNDNLILISQENRGQSYARNAGIKRSHGKYILFVDSDDYIDQTTVASIVGKMEKNNLDLIRFPAKSFNDGSNEYFVESKYNFKKYMVPGKIYYQDKFLKSCFNKGFIASPVLYMVKRDVIINNDIYFPLSYKMYEDEIFTLKLFLSVNKVMYDHKYYYFRRYREDSIMMQREEKENKLKSFDYGCQLVVDLYKLLHETTNYVKRKLINNRIQSRLRFLILLKDIELNFKRKRIIKISNLNNVQFFSLLFVYIIGKSMKRFYLNLKSKY